jgi:hypothetical protein
MVLFNLLTKRIVKTAFMACAVFAICHSSSAEASSLVFTGQNAALFNTANPSDTALLMNSVNKDRAASISNTKQSITEMIQNAVVGQISSKIYNDIFNGTAASGFYDLGNGESVSFIRTATEITITIVSAASGTTVITVPVL